MTERSISSQLKTALLTKTRSKWSFDLFLFFFYGTQSKVYFYFKTSMLAKCVTYLNTGWSMYGRQGEVKSTVGTSDSGLYFPCVNDLSLETVVSQKRRKNEI